ncbi:hypothetical protein D9757_001457 [Collybiopsis confluens]|uniref:AAA+ ATPase domain-containing protein n=1 Tax=Collybiopsis confluens TaxID=2823264 RepID=A0A8H5HZM7_9AGAR|nr:hypothetical protein D9757_001457 [Collybiopsis confluens]
MLGKHSRETDAVPAQLQTPEATPRQKRVKTTPTVLDGSGNKENIPPFNTTPVGAESSPPMNARTARSLRRSSTVESFITPSRGTALKKTVSFSNSFSSLAITTPPPTPLNLLPLHARVRALLRPTYSRASSMPGRESEREIITEFLGRFIDHTDSNSSHSLYVSGPPGCGKTALINSVLDSLVERLGDVRIVNINCMALVNLDALWDRLIDEFDGILQKKRKSGVSKSKGREMVESMLSVASSRCILVLDEIDHIASSPQPISSLLNLARSHRICVLGIANTHTLTSFSASSSEDTRVLHFSPYTSAQLLEILQSRLAALAPSGTEGTQSTMDIAMKKFLPLPTLTILTKKVATMTGDVRTLLEALRSAIDLAVASDSISATAKTDDDSFFAAPEPVCSVNIAHILQALKSATSSKSDRTPASIRAPSAIGTNNAIVSKVTGLHLQARLVLLAVLVAVKRTEAGLRVDTLSRNSSSSNPFEASSNNLTGNHLFTLYSHMLRRDETSSISTPVSKNEFFDLLGMLEGTGLVSLGSAELVSPKKKRTCFGRSASFKSSSGSSGSGLTEEVRLAPGVWADAVIAGLGLGSDSPSMRDAREEELSELWTRENVAIRKGLTAMETKKHKNERSKVFMDAFSDD